jgi:hypothetical protein
MLVARDARFAMVKEPSAEPQAELSRFVSMKEAVVVKGLGA